MADEIGDLQVNITGDFSELQTAIDNAASAASTGADAIASSLQSIGEASGLVGRDLENFQQLLQEEAAAGISLQQSLEDLAGSAKTVGDEIAGGAAAALESLQSAAQGAGDAASAAVSPLNDAANAESEVGHNAEEAETGLAGMAGSFVAIGEALAITEGLKEFVSEAIEVYGQTQQLEVSFQLLGASVGEAEAKIEELQQMSVNLAVPLGALEASARRLAVSFQDVEGVDLNDVLTAAADAAALTGRNFDTIAGALQRVEITGAVTSRQLVTLGLTMQQLADTMGVTVSQATALLKKGGQDAVTDLQAVLATIQQVEGGAAQAQAQTILGQFTILHDRVEILFDDIGQLIAPLVEHVTSDLSTMVGFATDAVNAFEQLPQPIQAAGIAFGGLAIAIPVAATALGTLGLSIAGIQKLLPAVESGLAAIGFETEGLGAAIGAIALPVSAVFGGIAAWIATIKLEGLISDFQDLANVVIAAEPGMVAVFDDVTTAAKTLASEIPFVSGAMSQLSEYFTGTNWIKNFIDAATPAFQLLDIAMKEVTTEATLAAVAFLTLTGHQAEAIRMLETLNGQTSTYIDDENDAVDVTDTYNEAVTETVGAHIKLASAVAGTTTSLTQAQSALNDAQAAYRAGTGSLQQIEQAQLAYNASLKATPAAATIAKNSIEDIAGSLSKANDAVVNAQGSVDKLNQYLADGITQLGGFDIAVELLPDAMVRLTKATQDYQTAIQGAKDGVTAFVNTVTTEISTFSNLLTTWTRLNALADQTPAAAIAADNAFKQLQTDAGKLGITLTNVGGALEASVTDPSKASADAIAALIAKFPQLNAAIDTSNQVMVQGQAIVAGDQAGFIKFTDAVEGTTEAYTPFVGAVTDGSTAIGGMTITTNANVVALDNEGNAAAGAVAPIQANTKAKTDNVAATKAMQAAAAAAAAAQEANNQVWVKGGQVVQSYAADTTSAVAANTNFFQAIPSNTDLLQTFAKGYQTVDGSIQAITMHAEQSAAAVQDLNNALLSAAASDAAWESASVSSLDGAKMGLSSYLSTALAVASSAATGGALGGGGIGGGQIDQMAQELANMTNQVVTTMDGTFIPAAQQAAEHLAGLQAQANATGKTLLDTFGGVQTVVTPQLTAFQQVTQANTASTTANTAATTANTTATTGATATLTAAQNSFLAAAASGDDVVTSFADLPTAIQDYLDGMNGTLVAYDDTTGALQYTVAGLSGLTSTVNAAVAPHELNTAAVVAATTATTALATATTAAAAGAASLGDATATAAAATATSATATTAAAAAVTALTTTFGAITNALAPSAASINPSAAGAANLGLLGGYGPSSFGYEQTTPGENQYPSTSGGVNLTVNVTGNSVTSQALVDQLATKVGSQLITVLRTTAGFKL